MPDDNTQNKPSAPFTIHIAAANGEGASYPVEESLITVGKDPANHIILRDAEVQDFHLEILFDENKVVVLPENPDRATHLDTLTRERVRLVSNAEWHPGKTLYVGPFMLWYSGLQGDESSDFTSAGGLGQTLTASETATSVETTEARATSVGATEAAVAGIGAATVGSLINEIDNGRVEITSLNKSEFELFAGESHTTTYLVTNHSEQPDTFRLLLEGSAQPWGVTSPPVRIGPGEQGTAVVNFSIPNDRAVKQGQYPYTVVAQGVNSRRRSDAISESISVPTTFQPRVTTFTSHLEPATANIDETVDLVIENLGNVNQTFQIDWKSVNGEIELAPKRESMTVTAGTTGRQSFTAKTQGWPGPVGRRHPYEVTVRSDYGDREIEVGEFELSDRSGLWDALLMGLLLLSLLAALVYFWPRLGSLESFREGIAFRSDVPQPLDGAGPVPELNFGSDDEDSEFRKNANALATAVAELTLTPEPPTPTVGGSNRQVVVVYATPAPTEPPQQSNWNPGKPYNWRDLYCNRDPGRPGCDPWAAPAPQDQRAQVSYQPPAYQGIRPSDLPAPRVYANGCIVDTDRDGLSDDLETWLGTDPLRVDTDGDRVYDGVEVYVWLTDPRLTDTDGDLCSDGEELDAHIDPLHPDSDGDGIIDGRDDSPGWGAYPRGDAYWTPNSFNLCY